MRNALVASLVVAALVLCVGPRASADTVDVGIGGIPWKMSESPDFGGVMNTANEATGFFDDDSGYYMTGIYDDLSGNNNGQWDPGELVGVAIQPVRAGENPGGAGAYFGGLFGFSVHKAEGSQWNIKNDYGVEVTGAMWGLQYDSVSSDGGVLHTAIGGAVPGSLNIQLSFTNFKAPVEVTLDKEDSRFTLNSDPDKDDLVLDEAMTFANVNLLNGTETGNTYWQNAIDGTQLLGGTVVGGVGTDPATGNPVDTDSPKMTFTIGTSGIVRVELVSFRLESDSGALLNYLAPADPEIGGHVTDMHPNTVEVGTSGYFRLEKFVPLQYTGDPTPVAIWDTTYVQQQLGTDRVEMMDDVTISFNLMTPLPASVFFMAPAFAGLVGYRARRRQKTKAS